MSSTISSPKATFVNAQDRAHIESQSDPHLREVMTASVARYRRADPLKEGDPIPALELTRLDDLSAVHLDELISENPLVLIFGSYT